jgi:NAD(P)-dependent dehydrogenase (short-subunit alcohol dehydrogenase family)
MADVLAVDRWRALVLGAGTPTGRAVAVALASAGADVAVASATTDGEEIMAARRTRRAVEAFGRKAAEYALDITLGQNVQVSTRQVAKELGGLNVLVTALSYPLRQAAERTSDSEWTRTIALNLGGVFFACRSAAREMAAGGGAIVAVTPSLEDAGVDGSSAYAAAQAGVVGLMRALAREYAGRGIRVYAVRTQPAGLTQREPPPELTAADLGVQDEIGAVCLGLVRDSSGVATGRLIGVSRPA